MRHVPLSIPKLAMPALGLASFRRRIIFRGAFLMLVIATLALALVLLKEEKQRSYENYAERFKKTRAEIVAKLRHPAGQLALLNPAAGGRAVTPLRPLVLPYAAIDFDDQNKSQQAVELAGCSVHYPDGGSVCVAVGNNPYAGGFIYLVGSFFSGPLVSRERGQLDLGAVHRARVSLDMRGTTTRWIAPYEALGEPGNFARGRLTGFADAGPVLARDAKPIRDFRGWLWQGAECADGSEGADCAKRAYFSIRLPVDVFREELFRKPRPAWPPADLDRIEVRIEMFGPGPEKPLFDSNAGNPAPPLSLQDLSLSLLPGETLRARKAGAAAGDIVSLRGADDSPERSAPWLEALIRRIPVEGFPGPVVATAVISTPVGSYEVSFSGDARSVDRGLGVVATRLSWFIGAMLVAIGIAWLAIEFGLIRRISALTRRAAAVSFNVQDARIDARIGELDVSDLQGRDELGILAGGLAALLKRVKDDVERERIRTAQERDMWHAVGHEIMSPLQSMMVLHGEPDDPSHRYVQRMQQAVRVLYGTASPSEALEAATLQTGAIDLDEFLGHVAANAHFAGIEAVTYKSASTPVPVRADEYSLEDTVTHILRNADRHRTPGTPITLSLEISGATASVGIRNLGKTIDPALLDRIFEYGVSGAEAPSGAGRRGQGLFVAKTYMAKMGGTIAADNEEDGVRFTLTLQVAS